MPLPVYLSPWFYKISFSSERSFTYLFSSYFVLFLVLLILYHFLKCMKCTFQEAIQSMKKCGMFEKTLKRNYLAYMRLVPIFQFYVI